MALVYLAGNSKSTKIRRATLEGKTHVVVPTVMMVSGVVPGSEGALYYPPEEMRKGPQAWNNKPAVVYHPEKNGKPSTAADPVVLNTQKVGVVLNAKFTEKDGKARWTADVWINEELGKQYMPDVMAKLDKGEAVEVSTGLYTENEAKEGKYNGRQYKAIARNYVPDHLAILPTGKGACSVTDGAGLLQNAAGGKCPKCGGGMSCRVCDKEKAPTANAISYTKLFQKVNKTLDERFGMYNAFVEDVYPDFLIYSKRQEGGERKLFKLGYKVDKRKGAADQVSLTGDPEQVERITEYRTPDGKFVGNSLYAGVLPQETAVDKTKLIAAIIANSNGQLDENDRAWLEGKSMEFLNSLPHEAKAAPAVVQIPAVVPPVETPVANAAKVPTFNELLQAADPDTREMVAEGINAARAERAKLTAVVVANARADYTDEELKGMSLKDLRRVAKYVGPKDAPAGPPAPTLPVANWAGAAGYVPPVANGGNALPVLTLPAGTKPVKAS